MSTFGFWLSLFQTIQSEMPSIWNADCLTVSPVICLSSLWSNCTAVPSLALFVLPCRLSTFHKKFTKPMSLHPKTYKHVCLLTASCTLHSFSPLSPCLLRSHKPTQGQAFACYKFVTRVEPCNWLTSALPRSSRLCSFLSAQSKTLQETWTLPELPSQRDTTSKGVTNITSVRYYTAHCTVLLVHVLRKSEVKKGQD